MVRESHVPQPGSYLVRLQVRIGRPLHTDSERLTATLWGREVSITSRNGPISKTDWLVLQARGFPSEQDARRFGERLRVLATLAGLCSHLGLDAGADELLGQFNEAVLQEMGFGADQRVPPEIHGISVLPDDGKSIFIYLNASGSVRSDPAQLLGALEELTTSGQCNAGEYPQALLRSLRLLNLALISDDSLAKIVLAISGIETLVHDERWSDQQRQWIHDTVLGLRTETDEEFHEIAASLERLHRISLRQGVFRLLDSNKLHHLKRKWDDTYGKRSALFHGTEQVDRHQLHQLATAAVRLCGTILLSIFKNQGVALPEIAAVHFPDIAPH